MILTVILQMTPPTIQERVIPTMVIAAIAALLLLGLGITRKNRGGLIAGATLLVGVVFVYVRFLTPYVPAYVITRNEVLFKIGDYPFTSGALGAAIVLIVVIIMLRWYKKRPKHTEN